MSSTMVATRPEAQRSPPLGRAARSSAFLVWGTPDKGPRSRLLAGEMGIANMWFCYTGLPRRRGTVPVRYVVQAIRTVSWLVGSRPRAVFVQHPPSIAVWIVAAYARAAGIPYVIDAHSAVFQYAHWRWPLAIHRWAMRGAAVVLVTDPHWAEAVAEIGANPLIVPDVPVEIAAEEPVHRRSAFTLVVVNTWAVDEPLEAIVAAAAAVPDVVFLVTGRDGPAAARFPALPQNVTFTGFLSLEAYHNLIDSADAVMCLTTRNHTMQRGACEALSHARPVVTSDRALLRDHFADAAVFVSDTPESIANGVSHLVRHYDGFAAAALRVRALRRGEWLERRDRIATLVTRPASLKTDPPSAATKGAP